MEMMGYFRHFRGGVYVAIGLARHSETEEELVVYFPYSCPGELWVRPLAMFIEEVDHEGVRQPRFERIEEGMAHVYHEVDPGPGAGGL
jgi:hypothetical protein